MHRSISRQPQPLPAVAVRREGQDAAILQDLRPQAAAFAELQHAVNASPRMVSQRQAFSGAVVQRVVTVDNQPAHRAQIPGWKKNKAAWRRTLRNWRAEATVHKFTSYQKLSEALRDARRARRWARGHPAADGTKVPDLFRLANYKYSTSAGGRLTTLYFSDGTRTGRLRQQHGSGPLAKVDSDKSRRIFFDSEGEARTVDKAARGRAKFTEIENRFARSPEKNTWTEPDVPPPGKRQVELHVDGDDVIVRRHRSEGITLVEPMTDPLIAAIYSRLAGRG